MIINTETNKTKTSSNASGSAMTVNITGTSFNFILDNLYTQPHRAIVRELSCNAWDAHVQAGNLVPFHIQVPSKFEQTFIIRDYGVGLTPDEIDKYLNTLYQSSKGESNDQIGGFGLGAKSPFALVQSFFISSYKDGMEYKCFWYRDSEGIPVLKIQSQKETTEPNGIKYIINFELKDVPSIIKACSSELLGLPVKPRFFSNIDDLSSEFDLIGQSGLSTINDDPSYLVLKDTGDLLDNTFIRTSSAYRLSSFRCLISIGGVLYPLPPSFNLNEEMKNYSAFLNITERNLYYVIKAKIGSLRLPSTREHILDTDDNKIVLKELLNNFVTEVLETLSEDYLSHLQGDPKLLITHINELPKYCKLKGMKYEGAVRAIVPKDLDTLPVTQKLFHPSSYSFKNTTAHNLLLEEFSCMGKSWNGSDIEKVAPLVNLRKVSGDTYRTSNSNYDKQNKFLVGNLITTTNKTLVVFDDSPKFMGAYLKGFANISSYQNIYRCTVNHEAPLISIEEVYHLLKALLKSHDNSNITFISCKDDLTKPPVAPNTNTVATPVPVPGIRLTDIRGVNYSYQQASPIFKVKDSDDKYIPFNSSYIKSTGIVGYYTQDHIDYVSLAYYKTLGITDVYHVRENNKEQMLSVLKACPQITKIVNIVPNAELNLDHIDQDLLTQYAIYSQLRQGTPDDTLRTILLNKYLISGKFSKLDQETLRKYIADKSIPRYHSETSVISDPNLKIVLLSYKELNKHTEGVVEDNPLDSFDDAEVLQILSTSLQPIMFQLVKRLIK